MLNYIKELFKELGGAHRTNRPPTYNLGESDWKYMGSPRPGFRRHKAPSDSLIDHTDFRQQMYNEEAVKRTVNKYKRRRKC